MHSKKISSTRPNLVFCSRTSVFRRLSSDTVAEDPKFPKNVRGVLEWNGKFYPYPYGGLREEEFTPELWEKLHKENVLTTTDGHFKPLKIKDAKLRRKINQMDDGKDLDYYVKAVAGLFLFFSLCGLLCASYSMTVA